VCAVRNAEWECGGRGPGHTQGHPSENLAKPERSHSEQHAAYTWPAGGHCRGWTGLRASLIPQPVSPPPPSVLCLLTSAGGVQFCLRLATVEG
jgi:hypothetical protein